MILPLCTVEGGRVEVKHDLNSKTVRPTARFEFQSGSHPAQAQKSRRDQFEYIYVLRESRFIDHCKPSAGNPSFNSW